MSLALRNHSFNLSLLLLPPHKRGKRSTSTQAMVFGIGSAITFASYYFSLLSDLSEAGIRNGGRGEAKKCLCNTHANAMRYGSVVPSVVAPLTNGRGRARGGRPTTAPGDSCKRLHVNFKRVETGSLCEELQRWHVLECKDGFCCVGPVRHAQLIFGV